MTDKQTNELPYASTLGIMNNELVYQYNDEKSDRDYNFIDTNLFM